MMRAFLIAFLALVIAACSSTSSDAKRHKKRQPTTSTGWYFQYGDPNPKMQADGVSSIWTASPYVEPHYWLKSWKPMLPTQTLSITYKIEAIEGNPVIKSTECREGQRQDAKAALMIRKNTDNTQRFNRAWFNVRPYMTLGTHTITAPLSGEGWKFVFSETALTNPKEWQSILANPIDIALTFNGCSSMGHGAYVEGGSIKITVVSVTVN